MRGIQRPSERRCTEAPGQTPRLPSRANSARSCSECRLALSWMAPPSRRRSIQDHSSTSAPQRSALLSCPQTAE